MRVFRYLSEDLHKCVGEVERARGDQLEAIDRCLKLMGKFENEINEKHSLEVVEEQEREERINQLM